MIDTIGSRIARLREQNGLSQADLAKRMNISRAGIHVSTDYLLDIDAVNTVNLDSYSPHEQSLIFRLLQYFDESASAAHDEKE